jgi:hypothetical protein
MKNEKLGLSKTNQQMKKIKKRDIRTISELEGKCLLLRGHRWTDDYEFNEEFSLEGISDEDFCVIAGFLDAVFDTFDDLTRASLRDINPVDDD